MTRPRIVDPARVDNQRPGKGAQIDQMIPLTSVPGEPGSLDAEHRADRSGYTMAAGKGVHFWCFAQSISALDTSWGKEHRKTLIHLAELVQILGFPRTDAEGAEELSKAIGTATFEGRTESKSGTIAESRIVTANT